MVAEQNPSFIETIRSSHEQLRSLPVSKVVGETWHGLAITLAPHSGSDVAFGLCVEEVDCEITISFDHCHRHLEWPPRPYQHADRIWWDGLALVDAILAEEVVASSGWINGEVRVGSLHGTGVPPELLVSSLQHIRTRSWYGTFNKDDFV